MTTAGPVIVLLAAGEGRRFGGAKQLALLEGEPMVRHAARHALACGVPVIAVTGAGAEAVEAALADLPLRIVRHAGWARGLGSSIAAGVAALRAGWPEASGALLHLADQPRVDRRWLQALLDGHAAAPARIVAFDMPGHAGPPVLFPRRLFPALATLDGPGGAQRLIADEGEAPRRVGAPGPATDLLDVDTHADLAHARRHL